MITIKSEREIELMRKAGMLVSEMHKFIKPYIKPGISTLELDRLCTEFIESHDGVASCIGYEGYPSALCTSVNDVVVHGIPHKEDILKDGDIITPYGMKGSMKLKKYFNSKGVNRHKRDEIPLLVIDNEVLWAAGVGLSNKIAVEKIPTHVIEVI